MSKLPRYNENWNIKYDVDCVMMDDANDCWVAALKMLCGFNGSPFDERAVSVGSSAFGLRNEDLAKAFGPYLTEHKTPLTSGHQIYGLLQKHGPALVVLHEGGDIQHAQVLTGRLGESVFLNNPENNFQTADMSASGPFNLIERGFTKRYGGVSFEDWDAGVTVAQAKAARGPTPPPSPRQTFVRAMTPPFDPKTPPGSAPGSPQASPRPSSAAAPSLPGPADPTLAAQSMLTEAVRRTPDVNPARRRAYIAAMEADLMFRENRSMTLRTFFNRVMPEFSTWTLKAW